MSWASLGALDNQGVAGGGHWLSTCFHHGLSWIPWAADEILTEISTGRVSPEAVRKYLTPVLRVLPKSAWEESSAHAFA